MYQFEIRYPGFIIDRGRWNLYNIVVIVQNPDEFEDTIFLSKIRTFDSLKTGTFRNYYFGMLGQWAAVSMQGVTQSFLVYYLTGSAAIIGMAALATGIPQLTLLLFGGALADRFQKKRLLQLSQLGECCSALVILIALSTGYLSKGHPGTWWMMIMTSFLSGVFNGLALPARQTMIAELVSNEQIMNAVSLTSMGQNIAGLIGPSIAGFLIGGIGFKAVYGAMVGLYLTAVILTNFLPVTATVSLHARNALVDVKEGLKYIRGNTVILWIIIFNLLCIFLTMPRNQLMPIFATDILKVGATGQGILMSITAVGSLAASLFYASLPPKKRGLIMLIAGLNLGITVTIFAFSRSYPLDIALMVFIGAGQSGHWNMGSILIQTMAEKEYVARTMSVMLMCQAMATLGTFFVSVIAQFAGAQRAVGSLGIILIMAAASSLIFLPQLRRLD